MKTERQYGAAQKAIVLNSENKILALHRTETAPARPNTWDLPGGDLDYGEDPWEAIKREIKEESGLAVEGLKLLDVEAHVVANEDRYWITLAYVCKAASDKVILSYEHDDFKWVTPSEFLELESAPKLIRFVKTYLINIS